jgi:HD-GYP domain-containing protein (c-di-GMP phosphodiesterase class II)
MLATLFQAIEARDPYTRGHSARVTAFAEAIAVRLGWNESELDLLRLAGRLHDVGKLGIAPEILRKPGPLDARERAEIELHPELGARLVTASGIMGGAVSFVLHHHERWDGGGYPHGRTQTTIPSGARILAVADAFDAMTSLRPYRRPLSHAAALAEIAACIGSQFDPEIASAFIEAIETGELAPPRSVARRRRRGELQISSARA